MLVALLLVAGCGGGGGGGGDDGGDSADLEAQATSVGELLDQIEALPTSATTAEQYSQQLAALRDQIESVIESVGSVDAPEDLRSQQNQLGNTLRSLRTQLNRVQSLADAGDLEAAVAATERLISIEQLRTTIAAIQDAGSAG